MVIRRIREHVAAHNWFAVGIDFLIVVAGIVIGTQVNNWNQARIERLQGRDYRLRLIDDLRSNERSMRHRQAYLQDVRRHASAALTMLEQPSQKAGEVFLIDAYQATQIEPRATKRSTYDEMIGTGGMVRLGQADIRARVTNYYVTMQTADGTFATITPFRDHLRGVLTFSVQQRIRTRCREIFGLDSAGGGIAILPKNCRLHLDPAIIAAAVAQVRASPGLTRDLTRHLNDLDMKIDLTTAFELAARDLRQRLETMPG